ncbi:MAG: SDR family NAD(P)-dependent oxidoreductase [Dehalococcoidia bacterium]|jgi:3-oxoacyl-[acyl-carrier protein] reductase
MANLDNQVAIVTGSATGIGYGISERLACDGSKIILVDFDKNAVVAAANDLSKQGFDVEPIVGDVAKPKTAQDAVNIALSKWNRVDILVNNAGIGGANGNIWELDVEELDRVYNTNLRGVFSFCHESIPEMLKNDYGRIVNIASIAGKEGNPKMVPYSATKAAVIGLTKSVGKELAGTGIVANCITPAVVQTRILEEFTPEVIEYMIGKIPIGRTAEVSEIASLVAWLSSSECSFSTGAVFDISGGRATY